MKKLLKRGGLALAGVCVGLLIAEAVFSSRDDGAFPHLNLYEEDPELGATLTPSSHQRFKLGSNPVSEIHINSDGFRGGEHAKPSEGEIWTFGDSQVFGLGVNDDEPFSSVLAKSLKTQVINFGVPTYGPGEVERLFEQQLKKRKAPAKVIVTINMVNDIFEENRPNRERHKIWDGWAVRLETKPDDVFEFPGRRWLFSKSHLVYAARKALHTEDISQVNFASEGTWNEVVALGAKQENEKAAIEAKQAAQKEQREAQWKEVSAKLKAKGEKVRKAEQDFLVVEAQESYLTRANPGDIVRNRRSESSRPTKVTAAMLKQSAEFRSRFRVKYKKARKEFVALRKSVRAAAPTVMDLDFPLKQHVLSMKKLADEHKTELVVLILPIDVQVSESQWKKYDTSPIDMTSSLALNEEIRSGVEKMGLRVIDPRLALQPKVDASFLDGDIHLTALGHRTVATEIVKALSKPKPVLAEVQAPIGSPIPSPEEWLGHPKIEKYEKGDGRIKCSVRHADEWVMLECRGVKIFSDDDRSLSAYAKLKGRVRWVAPIRDGETRILRVARKNGELDSITLTKKEGVLTAKQSASESVDPPERVYARFCKGDDDYFRRQSRAGRFYAPVSEACTKSYPNDCIRQRACDHGSSDAPPMCSDESKECKKAGSSSTPITVQAEVDASTHRLRKPAVQKAVQKMVEQATVEAPAQAVIDPPAQAIIEAPAQAIIAPK